MSLRGWNYVFILVRTDEAMLNAWFVFEAVKGQR